MTAIDTSKLKEGMFCKFKYYGKDYEGKIEIDGTGIKVLSYPWFYIATREGEIATGISDIVFPDLQEQDRVEANVGDYVIAETFTHGLNGFILTPYRLERVGKKAKIESFATDHTHARLDFEDGSESLWPISAIRSIPKPDPDGELRRILIQSRNYMYPSTCLTIDEAIVKIKSLLAAKVPSRKEMADYLMGELPKNYTIEDMRQAAFRTIEHFTKNETK